MRLYKHFITLVLLLNFLLASREIINIVPTEYDRVFKHIFADSSNSSERLTDMLNAFLGFEEDSDNKIVSVTVTNSSETSSRFEIYFDIKLRCKMDGKEPVFFDIEMQKKNQTFFYDRMNFYEAVLITSAVQNVTPNKGSPYGNVPTVRLIAFLKENKDINRPFIYHMPPAILDAPLIEGNIDRDKMRNFDVPSNKALITFVQLSKIADTKGMEDWNPDTPRYKKIQEWCNFINIGGNAVKNTVDGTIRIEKPDYGSDIIKGALEDLIRYSQTTEIRDLARDIQKKERDALQAESDAMEKGLAEGLKEGKAEGLKEGLKEVLRTWYDDFYNEKTAEFDRVPRSLKNLDVSQLDQYVDLVDSIEEIGDKPRFKDAIRVAKRTRSAKAEGPIAKRAHH